MPDQKIFIPLQMDRDVEVINVAHSNTVRTLRDQLARVDAAGYANTGFPIIRTDEGGRAQMLGFIGGNELEHALSASPSTHSPIYTAFVLVLIFLSFYSGIVAEEADQPISFDSNNRRYRTRSSSFISTSTLMEPADDPFDFSLYMDKV
jgi:chloride channel 3/4/5